MIFPTGRRALLTALVAGAAGSAPPFATHAQVLTLGAAVDSACDASVPERGSRPRRRRAA